MRIDYFIKDIKKVHFNKEMRESVLVFLRLETRGPGLSCLEGREG